MSFYCFYNGICFVNYFAIIEHVNKFSSVAWQIPKFAMFLENKIPGKNCHAPMRKILNLPFFSKEQYSSNLPRCALFLRAWWHTLRTHPDKLYTQLPCFVFLFNIMASSVMVIFTHNCHFCHVVILLALTTYDVLFAFHYVHDMEFYLIFSYNLYMATFFFLCSLSFVLLPYNIHGKLNVFLTWRLK